MTANTTNVMSLGERVYVLFNIAAPHRMAFRLRTGIDSPMQTLAQIRLQRRSHRLQTTVPAVFRLFARGMLQVSVVLSDFHSTYRQTGANVKKYE
jgi:hypothetical protein